MKEKYRIGEVEKILGIPRTTIRYYIKKGMIHVDKDASNGYRYYSQKDIFEIMHILIGRNVLSMSVENSNERIHAKSLDDFDMIFNQQEKILHDEITKANRSLAVLSVYKEMLHRIEENLDTFQVIKGGPFYVLSSKYLFNAKTSAFDIGFHTSVFTEENGLLTFSDVCSFVHDKQKELLSKEDFDAKLRTVANRRYVFTVLESDQGMESPNLLLPALEWAREQKIPLEAPYYLSYLFRVEKEKKPHYYYEVHLPIKE